MHLCTRQKHQTALQNSNAGGFFYVFQITRARRMQKRRIEEESTCEREKNLISSPWWCKVCAAIFHLMSALLTEGNAKCCHLKKLTCKGTLRKAFICLRPRTPYPPSLTHCIRVYSILTVFTQGRGGIVEPEKRLEGQQFTKLGRKYQDNWMYQQSINFDKHLPQSPYTGQFF